MPLFRILDTFFEHYCEFLEHSERFSFDAVSVGTSKEDELAVCAFRDNLTRLPALKLVELHFQS